MYSQNQYPLNLQKLKSPKINKTYCCIKAHLNDFSDYASAQKCAKDLDLSASKILCKNGSRIYKLIECVEQHKSLNPC